MKITKKISDNWYVSFDENDFDKNASWGMILLMGLISCFSVVLLFFVFWLFSFLE